MVRWRRAVSVFGLGLVISGRPGLASAQEQPSAEPPATEEEIEKMSLQQMLQTPIEVWTATKTRERRSQAPAIITTVTREQIEVLGFRSIAELLNNLVGFYI